MFVTLEWPEVVLRLALTVVAGVLLGINRSERGVAAGLRTTLLVCLAAAVSMIQANLLLGTAGKPDDSFVSLDLMRLPLGILTGMGFIGAGAILRRGDLVLGVTTAATLWLATVVGLCFGGGQIVLGLAALGFGLVVLWGLKWPELFIPQERRARLVVTTGPGGPGDEDLQGLLKSAGYAIKSWDASHSTRGESSRRRVCCDLRWRGRQEEVKTPEFVNQLAGRPGVLMVRWKV